MDRFAFVLLVVFGVCLNSYRCGLPMLASAVAGEPGSAASIAAVAADYAENGRQPERRDCSGLVEEVLERAGVSDHEGSVAQLFALAEAEGVLVAKGEALMAGDVLFFDFTYIRGPSSPPTREDFPLTHIAVVVRRTRDGAWLAVHYSSTHKRPVYLKIDPLHPEDPSRNDHLAKPGHPPADRLLYSGELLRAAARFGRTEEPEPVVLPGVGPRSTSSPPPAA